MKNLTFLRTIALVAGMMMLAFSGWGQGFETFDNLGITGTSYQDGTFLGQDGSTWTFWQCRGDYEITGKAIMLGRNRTPQPEVYSGTILGGIGELNFDYMQAFGTNVNLNVLINDVVVGNVTSSGQQNVVLNSGTIVVNQAGSFVIKFINVNNSDGQVVIDNVAWTPFVDADLPPTISNIIQTPDSDITSTTTVGVSAEISEGDAAISEVKLKWGTSTGIHPNEINMEMPSKGTTYFTVSDIPAQSDDTTVYYVIYAEDENGESATSPEQSYSVRDPRLAVLPFDETFDTDLGDCYTYSVSGDNYYWIHNSFGGNGFAQMSGFGSSELEEDWLILPGIDMSEYESVVLTFESLYRFHSSNEDHEFLLLYSIDYDGIGIPTLASWEELDFVRPTADAWDFIPSGDVILPETNEVLWLAFKYKYEDDYPTWRIDNIIIIDLGEPLLEANPSSLSDFLYFEDLGPSAPQSFELTGINLDPDEGNILVNAGENFEVSIDDLSYDTSVELPYIDSELSAVNVFVRLKEGLVPGEYAEVITITGGGAATETVTVDGNVLHEPPGLPYAEDFSEFESAETLPEAWYVSNKTYNGDWGEGVSAGLRGNANVLGFQHTSGTGIFTASIALVNNTGSTLEELYISYTGMVERITEGRSPEWTVALNGIEIPDLFYSTEDGVDKFKSVFLTGLSIAENEVFTISWSSDRGEPSGASKQIGIGDVYIDESQPDAPLLFVNPTTLSGLNYIVDEGPSEEQSFTVSGMNLVDNIVVTAPAGFEIYTEFKTGFSDEIILPQIDGIVTERTIDVRLIQDLDIGTYTGTLTVYSEDAVPVEVSLNGEVTEPPLTEVPFTTDFGVAENWDLITTAGAYGEKAYEDGGWYFHSTEAIREGAAESFDGSLHSFRDRGDFTINNLADLSGMTGFSLQLRDWMTGAGVTRTIKVSFNGGETWEEVGVIDKAWFDEYQVYQPFVHYFTHSHDVDVGDLIIEMVGGVPGTNDSRINIGQFKALDDDPPPPPLVADPVFDLLPGNYFEDQTVFIDNYDDYAETVSVYYTLDGEDPDAGSLLYDHEEGILLADGDGPVTLKAIAIDAGKTVASEITSAVYNFPLNVASIAELRDNAVLGNLSTGPFFRITGEVFMTYQNDSRNQKYFQDGDAAAGVKIDDNPGNLTTVLDIGDGVENLVGALNEFNRMLRLLPVEGQSPEEASSTGNEIEPLPLTLAELIDSDNFFSIGAFEFSIYQGLLIKVNELQFEQDGVFDSGANFGELPISDPTASLEDIIGSVKGTMFRVEYADLEYNGEPIPQDPVNLTAIVDQRSDNSRIFARSWDDFEEIEVVIPDELFLADDADVTVGSGEIECFFSLVSIVVAGGDYEFVVEDGGEVTLVAVESITMLPGTKVLSGGYLHAYIDEENPCGIPAAKEEEVITAIDPMEGTRFGPFFKVYPNPTTGEFTVELLNEIPFNQSVRIEVYNLMGTMVASEELPAENQYRMSLLGQQPGMYIIRVFVDGQMGIERLIKR